MKAERNDPCPCGSGKKYKKCCLGKETFAIPGHAVQAAPPGSRSINTTNTAAASGLLMQAVAMHQAGMLDQAEAAYQSLLKINPGDSDALHYLGLIAFQRGQHPEAVRLIGAAIAINRSIPAFHCNLGNALRALGQADAAVAAFREAVRLDPRFLAAHINLGGALKEQGKPEEAVPSYRTAISLDPNYADAHNNLGTALQSLGRLDEAISSYRTAISLSPAYADAHNNLGAALHDQGRLDASIESYRRALALRPDFFEARSNLGFALLSAGNPEAAIASFRDALRNRPHHAEALYGLGNALEKAGKLTEAVAGYRKALQVNPDYVKAHIRLGYLLRDMGKMDEAMESYRAVLQARGDWTKALDRLTQPVVMLDGLALDPKIEVGPGRACQAPAPQELAVAFPARVAPAEPRKLRIALIYPPPWKIPAPGEVPAGMPFGPPQEARDQELDEDFKTITYGLLTIAAEARRAGHEVTLHNLAVTPWREVAELIREMQADVYGISSFTANRRGMGAMAELIRQHHPQAHIAVGGPFVTALPEYTLRYYRDIDTAVIGEGESTFMELLERLGTDRPATGIAGTAWREGEEVKFGPSRARIGELDALASPFDYFTSDIVMTSRGCPEKCTFCGSVTTWGKKLRFHSVESTLELFSKALSRLPIPFLAVKDDTFTASRKRALAICDAIIERKMNFLWSCDTRVDSLDEELLYRMRLAGCQMISLGIESGSPEILKTIKKNTDTEHGLEATRAARKYGINVRYYMMLGNRGESPETVRQSVEMIRAGRPSRYFFSPLSFFPGTEDWETLREREGLTPDVFFNNDFRELAIATGRQEDVEHIILQITCDVGKIDGFDYTIEEREAVAGLLPGLHAAHLELANAYLRAGRLDEAEAALRRAEELGFPIPGMIHNQRACIALARGDANEAQTCLSLAVKYHPHSLVMKNFDALQGWISAPADARGEPPLLDDSVLARHFN